MARRDADARQRLGRGLAYLVFLSSLYAAAIAIALLAFWLPAADRFVDWLAPNLPEVKLTDHGAVTDAPQPFVLTHPTLGTLLAIDTRVETPSADDLRGAPVFFVSRTQVVVSEGRRDNAACTTWCRRRPRRAPAGRGWW